MWRCFCSSLPYSRRVGPIIEVPMPISGERALIFDISSKRIFACAGVRPPPPYSVGQVGTVQPRCAIRSSQRATSGSRVTLVEPVAI
jgi:hypothetical protein